MDFLANFVNFGMETNSAKHLQVKEFGGHDIGVKHDNIFDIFRDVHQIDHQRHLAN